MLFVVDYFLKWIEVFENFKTITEAVVRDVEVIATRFEVLITIQSRNCLCYSSEAFRRISKD